MNRIKTLLASTALFALAAGGAALTPITAQATAPPSIPPQQHTYYVYYRDSPNSSWICYGGYYTVEKAQQAVNWFRANGYDALYQ